MEDLVTTRVALVQPSERGAFAVTSLTDGTRVVLDRATEIGRSATCGLALADRAASRCHVRLEPDGDDSVVVIDLGSRNGTFVDGRRVTRIAVDNAIVRVGDHVLRIARSLGPPAASGTPLVGGTAIAAIHRALVRVAPARVPVLVLGETGTGKDVVARMIHAASRTRGPFVAVNCAARPLADAELQARCADATGGTLFLDEVGELAPTVQARLLAILEDTARDIRIIAASHRDLYACVNAGTFRADVLARLAGAELRLPPLRARAEDLLALVRYLWERANGRAVTVTADALEALAIHPWPHNVRELDHVVRTASIVDRDALDLPALPDAIAARLLEARRASAVVPRVLHADRRSEIEAVLRDTGGNIRRAAHALGIARGHLYRLLARWEVDPESYRS